MYFTVIIAQQNISTPIIAIKNKKHISLKYWQLLIIKIIQNCIYDVIDTYTPILVLSKIYIFIQTTRYTQADPGFQGAGPLAGVKGKRLFRYTGGCSPQSIPTHFINPIVLEHSITHRYLSFMPHLK